MPLVITASSKPKPETGSENVAITRNGPETSDPVVLSVTVGMTESATVNVEFAALAAYPKMSSTVAPMAT